MFVLFLLLQLPLRVLGHIGCLVVLGFVAYSNRLELLANQKDIKDGNKLELWFILHIFDMTDYHILNHYKLNPS